jgi:prolyl oligopeptidase
MVIQLPVGGKGAGLPMILEGYGSNGINNIAPWYNPPALAWLAHGGAYAFCGTRGGNERGRSWHEDGRETNKPKAHADFIACAEELEAKGYTSPAMLVATGTSAGGTPVPPSVPKRPDLFAGLISRVAIVNATRLGTAENGANQFAEFGNPGTKEGFSALAGQDAYLMMDSAKDLPDTLVTVGLNDRRVSPWMGAKFAARAAAKFGDHRMILIRADAEAGHGFGSARDNLVAEWVDTLPSLGNARIADNSRSGSVWIPYRCDAKADPPNADPIGPLAECPVWCRASRPFECDEPRWRC